MRIKAKLSNGEFVDIKTVKSPITLGRSHNCDVPIPEESLSRTHCQIEFSDDKLFITDTGSANGVFIDGERIVPHIKTEFSTFQEILLGPIEITLTYDESNANNFLPRDIKPLPKDFLEAPTKPKRTINTSELNKPFTFPTEKDVKKPKSISPSLYILPILVIAAAIYFQFQSGTEEISQSNETVNLPNGVAIEDKFLPLRQYQEKDSQKICDNTSCKEGTLKTEKEAFIFIAPGTELENPKFQKIENQEDKNDLISIYLTLKSPIFESFRKKEILQIHTLVKNDEGRISKVFRFHAKYFSTNGPEKARLLSELTTAMDSGNSEMFWKEARVLIKKNSY